MKVHDAITCLRIRAYLTFICSQVGRQCQITLKLQKQFSFQLVSKIFHVVNEHKNCSGLKITVVKVQKRSAECLEAQEANAIHLDHPRVHCYAGSQKHHGDFMAPSTSRAWATIQSPKHKAREHTPA